jgi:DNA polymerase-3 subunit delta
MAGKIYLFHGEDTYALAAARQKLERELLDPAWRDFNLTVLPPDAPGRRIVEALLAVPFGAGHRLVVVKDAAFLAAKGDDPSLEDLERLCEQGLPDNAALLLTAPKADARLKLVKKLQGAAVVREFAAPKPWQVEEALTPWVEEQVAGRQRRIQPQAVSALIAATGGDRWKLLREIDKLTTYASESERITPEMVQALVAGGEVEVFALTDALAAKRAGDALAALGRLLTSEHALKVAAAVVTVMRNWLKLKSLAARGLGPAQIAQATGARSDFKVKKDLEAIRGWSAPQLERALELLARLDWGIKSGAWPPDHQRVLWEKAVAEMLGPL